MAFFRDPNITVTLSFHPLWHLLLSVTLSPMRLEPVVPFPTPRLPSVGPGLSGYIRVTESELPRGNPRVEVE